MAGKVKTPNSVTVGPSTAGTLKIGDDQTYTATVNWSDGSQSVETATWSSDNTAVATVDGTGKAHGVNSGEATLIAKTTTSNAQGTLKIRVVPNYQGTWTGDSTVRNCIATGAFDPADWCGRDGFAPGTILPITLAFTQSAGTITGTITLGSDLNAVPRTASLMGDDFAPPVRLSSPFDILRLMRQK